MKALPLFDLHCDTVTEAYDSGKDLMSNDLHISFERLAKYSPFCQVMAVWSSDKAEPHTAWQKFFTVREFLLSELSKTDTVRLISCGTELSECERDGVGAVILAVEGGKIIGDDLSRLDTLRTAGVRFLTLTWNDPCPICGANGTDMGVTDFGYKVLDRCRTLGIIPDISHASDKSAYDVISYCEQKGGICIATHSNSRTVCDHSRNLTDDIFKRLIKLGSIVGISMAVQHLNAGGSADINDILRHIEHYLSLGGENTVCLGCDFDGIESTPEGIESVSELYKLADALAKLGYPDELIEKLFCRNAQNFIKTHI